MSGVGADLAGLDARIRQVLYSGRGITGASGSGGNVFSAHAQLLGIPVGTFLPTPQNAPLEDSNYDAEAFDRRARIYYLRKHNDTPNELDAMKIIDVDFQIRVGYLFGAALKNANLFQSQGTETAAANYDEPELRAMGDGEQIARALCYGEIYQGTDISPSIMLLDDDDASVQYLQSGGRLVGIIPFRARLIKNLSGNSVP